MERQPFVDERVVSGQQIEDAAILAHDAVEEHLDLALERPAQTVVEVRVDVAMGATSRMARTLSHCPVKLLDQGR